MEVKTYSEILSCHVVLIINLRQNSTIVFPGKGKALNSTLRKLFGMSSGEGSYLEADSWKQQGYSDHETLSAFLKGPESIVGCLL